ncbi:MAG: chemotaxis protein CheB [Deltaproteobacteria bacterium]|nr:chemotaxis protein CheB [Deltaproteobacteria bacterium]
MSQMSRHEYKAVVVGVSAGGLTTLTELFSLLPGNFSLPMLVVQHLHPEQVESMSDTLARSCALTVKDAVDKEEVRPGCVYFAPPNYHLLVERGGSLALSMDDKVNWARPSIDVLFESAVYAWAPALVGVILTGANNDGAQGLRQIKEHGGLTIAQDPKTAEYPEMPLAAIDTGAVDMVLTIEKIGELLKEFGTRSTEDE